jgi:transcriptional regulator with XRE-family HTH domain
MNKETKQNCDWASSTMNVDASIADRMLRMELANIRRSKHVTQKELSKRSGLSESCISNIESGEETSPTLRSLVRYATALGVELYINLNSKNVQDE